MIKTGVFREMELTSVIAHLPFLGDGFMDTSTSAIFVAVGIVYVDDYAVALPRGQNTTQALWGVAGLQERSRK